MEMCYDGALIMPSSYAVMSEDEMTYMEVQLINVNSKMKKILCFFLPKKGCTCPLVKISFFKRYCFIKVTVFYAAMSHLAALYCLLCSCGVMISKGLLSLSIANIMLHTL